MHSHRLSLKPGVSPAQASAALQPLLLQATNVTTGAGGPEILRDRYLEWVEAVEAQLAGLSRDPAIVQSLQTARYWHIRNLDETGARPMPLVRSEIALQVGMLTDLLGDLEERVRTLGAAPGHIAVLDTNILLHCLPLADIPWVDVIGEPTIRLVAPLRVIEELDAKKYSRRTDLADKARRLLAQLESIVGPNGAPSEIRPGITVEVPVESERRIRPTDADEEILLACNELEQLTGRAVTLVTADTSTRLRAHARGIHVVHMPSKYQRTAA